MEFDRQAILESFLAESEEGLEAVEDCILKLEQGFQPEAVQAIFRVVHTLKGNAAIFGFDDLSQFAHRVEGFLDRMRSNDVLVDEIVTKSLLGIVDVFRDAISAVVGGKPFEFSKHDHLLTALEAVGKTTVAIPEAISGPVRQESKTKSRTLRVSVDKLDALMNLAGEIGIVQARMREGLAQSAADQSWAETFSSLDALLVHLQEQVTALRMVQIGPTLHRYSRIAHDIAAGSGKRVSLQIEGEEVGVDLSVLELIRDPLTHIVRNAVDHGIETPVERRRHGKPVIGRLFIRAFHESGTVVLQIQDDGRGLDRQRIVERARALGLCPEPEKLPNPELFRYIFEPGFSTVAEVTDISGRGVGMDVVKRNIELLHGRVEVASEAGRGTTITIRLPLTLAMVEGFLVRVGVESYVVPLDSVIECMDVPHERIEDGHGRGVINVRGVAIPYVRLASLFDARTTGESERVVLVREDGVTTGIVVDELIGEHQAVIKPLARLFRDVRGIASSTILGDGRVALVLDVAALVREAVKSEATLTVVSMQPGSVK